MLNPILGEVFAVDKPLGITSFAAVRRVRGVLQRRLGLRSLKVGHAGTLDPLATGVLIICTGHATKRIGELQAGVKQYVAGIRLGATTPSFDLETSIDATYPWEHITRETIEQVLAERFTGSIEQIPPAFSACKVDGKPAYKLARRGQDVAIEPRILVIDEIALTRCELPQEPLIEVTVTCSKGTYIRALARDIGQALGSGAHLTSLRRTRVGDFDVATCPTLDQLIEQLQQEPMVPADEAEQQRLEAERIANRQRAAALKAAQRKRQQQTEK